MTTTYEETLTFVTISCGECDIAFGVPTSWYNRKRDNHTTWTCPNGHVRHFAGKSDADKLRDELAATRSRLDQARAWAVDEERQRLTAENRVRAHKGVVTKMRKRIANGVCPCCHAKFRDLRDHMRAAHPDWNPEKGAETIAAKS